MMDIQAPNPRLIDKVRHFVDLHMSAKEQDRLREVDQLQPKPTRPDPDNRLFFDINRLASSFANAANANERRGVFQDFPLLKPPFINEPFMATTASCGMRVNILEHSSHFTEDLSHAQYFFPISNRPRDRSILQRLMDNGQKLGRTLINEAGVALGLSFFSRRETPFIIDALCRNTLTSDLTEEYRQVLVTNQSGNLTTRQWGTRRALTVFFSELFRNQPNLYKFCFESATKLQEERPLKKQPKALVCVSVHQDEDIERFLAASLKQNIDLDAYPIYLFVNGNDQEKIDGALGRIEKFQTEHKAKLNLRVISTKLDRWSNGFKAMAVNTALMDYALSGHLQNTDADIPLIFHDADIVDMPVDLWHSHSHLINSGAVISSGQWRDDLEHIGRTNINYRLLAAIHNTDFYLFVPEASRPTLSLPSKNGRNASIWQFWFPGANSAASAQIYALTNGISVLADGDERSLYDPILKLLTNTVSERIRTSKNSQDDKAFMSAAHQDLIYYLNHNYLAHNSRKVVCDGGAVLRAVERGVPATQCMAHGDSERGDLSKNDFGNPKCVNVQRFTIEMAAAADKAVSTLARYNSEETSNAKTTSLAHDIQSLLDEFLLAPLKNELRKIAALPDITWSSDSGGVPRLRSEMKRLAGSGDPVLKIYCDNEEIWSFNVREKFKS